MNNAGSWWLKGAWIELGLEQAVVDVIESACRHYRTESSAALRVLTHSRGILIRKNETLVFMPLFENMTRLIHLDTYEDDGLGWLTEMGWVYQSDTLEHYLSELTWLKIAASLGQALARCYWQAWYQDEKLADRHVFYVDMHDKVIWTSKRSPVGYVGARHEVQACLKQVFVHGHAGHPLFCLTYPADVHLSEIVIEVALALDQAIGQEVVQVIVTDREGLSVEVIQTLLEEHHKALVVLLKANQYTGEANFVQRGRFRQLKHPRTGQITHRVADADFDLTEDLTVRAGLIYDLDHPDDLRVLITTVGRQAEANIVSIVRWYLERWNAQENSFRDQIAFVHLNTNFGLRAKREVPDRRVARQITDLTTHLEAVKRKLDRKLAQLAEQEARIQNLNTRYDKKMVELLQPPKQSGPKAIAHAAKRGQQLQDYRQGYHQRLTRYLAHKAKLEKQIEAHRAEQTRTTNKLAQLNPQATFFEIDTERDQIMAHLRIALHNTALWTRDQYFGPDYCYSTPLTLWRTFFNQDGFYLDMADRIVVTLKPFTNPRVQQEAINACQRFNKRQIKTLSGKFIEMRVADCI